MNCYKCKAEQREFQGWMHRKIHIWNQMELFGRPCEVHIHGRNWPKSRFIYLNKGVLKPRVRIRAYLSWLVVASKDIPSFSVENRTGSIDIGIVFESECHIFIHGTIEINDEWIQFVVWTTMLKYQNWDGVSNTCSLDSALWYLVMN